MRPSSLKAAICREYLLASLSGNLDTNTPADATELLAPASASGWNEPPRMSARSPTTPTQAVTSYVAKLSCKKKTFGVDYAPFFFNSQQLVGNFVCPLCLQYWEGKPGSDLHRRDSSYLGRSYTPCVDRLVVSHPGLFPQAARDLGRIPEVLCLEATPHTCVLVPLPSSLPTVLYSCDEGGSRP